MSAALLLKMINPKVETKKQVTETLKKGKYYQYIKRKEGDIGMRSILREGKIGQRSGFCTAIRF